MEVKFTSKANHEGIEREYTVIANLWEKNGKSRLYLKDGKKDLGYYDRVSHQFQLSGSPSNWKDDMKKAIEAYSATIDTSGM